MDPLAMTVCVLVGRASIESFLHRARLPVTTDRAIVEQYLDAKDKDLAVSWPLSRTEWRVGHQGALGAFVKSRGPACWRR